MLFSFTLPSITQTLLIVPPLFSLSITHPVSLVPSTGGFISFNGSWRVQGILAMSRSLGDYPLKNLNVIVPDPDIMSFDLNKLQPEFMILASDGLWDTFSNEEAVRFIRERLDEPHFGAKSIVLQSFYRGCPDNITVMVVKFKGKTGEKK
ncbi:Protein phosphatase 1L [Characodon lateralis]|uniref:Protein phosphatase 1L n=1 Tax=Characodon lateralis TaxID=208331 RepID=A0ABU7ED94_9TELE|nr:Protein phosphatase 1L [Characodon lateralis]